MVHNPGPHIVDRPFSSHGLRVACLTMLSMISQVAFPFAEELNLPLIPDATSGIPVSFGCLFQLTALIRAVPKIHRRGVPNLLTFAFSHGALKPQLSLPSCFARPLVCLELVTWSSRRPGEKGTDTSYTCELVLRILHTELQVGAFHKFLTLNHEKQIGAPDWSFDLLFPLPPDSFPPLGVELGLPPFPLRDLGSSMSAKILLFFANRFSLLA